MTNRVYLDYNATTPLCASARAAMLEAMDLVGNPSSVHAEGRKAKAMLEKARAQVSAALGADGADIIFTSGATEAAALGLANSSLRCSAIEHDAVTSCCEDTLACDAQGLVDVSNPNEVALQYANSETGVVQSVPNGIGFCDMTQAFGKLPIAFNWTGAQMAAVSAHKIGGPKGIGALVVKRGTDIQAQIKGGGQEMGRRSGTENLVGIAGFGAAAAAAAQDLEAGVWLEIEILRNFLENTIAEADPDTIIISNQTRRLPNTSCLVTPGWKGETQVMQMDLDNIAISAGSACSSGKVKSSRVLKTMGLDDMAASSAIRISLGPDTTKGDVERFLECWTAKRAKYELKRAG
jgi:cysteine desulfurase